jgi:hypothetical protein
MINKIKILTDYPEEVVWVKFTKFESWEFFYGYAYNVELVKIQAAINLLRNKQIYELVYSEIDLDWQDAKELKFSKDISQDLKHLIRIACLIELIPQKGIRPVHIDTYSRSYSKLEGHHRLLALKFLGFEVFPVFLSGRIRILEALL